MILKKLIASFFVIQSIINWAQIKDPASFFPEKKTKVLVVGTFHFDYPNLDVTKVLDADKIDVLTEPKKSEVTALINYIKKFKPTKIGIEAYPSWNAKQKLDLYKAGKLRNVRDERYQIGFRLAAELKLDTIYSIDAASMEEDLTNIDSVYTKKLFEDFDFKSEDPLSKNVSDWFAYENSLVSKMTILDNFKRTNSRKYYQLGYGAYLVGDFKLENNRGADILAIWWYNRNLRIFRKIQEMKSSPDDRLLILIGNGHASVLRQLLESSPEFEFIEFENLK